MNRPFLVILHDFNTYGHSYGGSAWRNGARTSFGDIPVGDIPVGDMPKGWQKPADKKAINKCIILVEVVILVKINSEL